MLLTNQMAVGEHELLINTRRRTMYILRHD